MAKRTTYYKDALELLNASHKHLTVTRRRDIATRVNKLMKEKVINIHNAIMACDDNEVDGSAGKTFRR